MQVKGLNENLLLDARWFAGKHRVVRGVSEGGAFAPPGASGRLVLADVAYADGGSERYLVAEAGEGFWGRLVAALAAGPIEAAGGRLELRRGPAFDELFGGAGAPESVPSTDQTNTLVGLGDRLLVKAYRRLAPGVHPEVELCGALDGAGAPVPRHAGSIHHVAADGAETAVALLQELVAGADAGWESPILRVAALLRDGGDVVAAGAEYAEAGRVAARLHAALARVTSIPAGAARDRYAEASAVVAEAAASEPLVAEAREAIIMSLAPLAQDARGLQRVHGDLHYAQYLRAPGRLLVIDFEGDPTLPLAARRRPDVPSRDLACLLRSIDHIGSAAARRAGADPEPWIAAAADAALAAYEDEAGAPVDRRLLHALELAKECQELIYAHRVLPEWAYAPRLGLQRLLRASAP